MYWYLKVLKQYADFNGRARRKEYWMFILFNIIFSAAAAVLDTIFGTWGAIGGLYAVLMLIPGLAVGARRLHDTGRSGWMLLIALIPIIGAIWLIILFVGDSAPGSNEYGANPKNQ
ncbi:DUF805 domain-containing protein [uncultured Draconibacterium sp.]|uniref:DUF805 domain-containing protein n=1 Tax=uncultured Draconibacterium sp. TaxID=1573823 RepID=UPI0029C09208|nr:DUF805 domain-containing protein [uncultured Draconibacterium sp.]